MCLGLGRWLGVSLPPSGPPRPPGSLRLGSDPPLPGRSSPSRAGVEKPGPAGPPGGGVQGLRATLAGVKPPNGLTLAQGDRAQIRGDAGTQRETAGSCQAASPPACSSRAEGGGLENNNKYKCERLHPRAGGGEEEVCPAGGGQPLQRLAPGLRLDATQQGPLARKEGSPAPLPNLVHPRGLWASSCQCFLLPASPLPYP